MLVVAAVVAALAGTAPAEAIAPAFDSRDATRARLDLQPPRGFAATAAVRLARRALARSLGPRGVLEIDPLTQTPRVLARPGGALTDPSSQAPATVALGYVRTHLGSLGLGVADLATLHDRSAYTSSDGVTHVRWTQSYGGIPAYDNELRVNVDRGGRVIDVLGSPRHDLSVASTVPALDAGRALAAVRAAVGDRHTTPVTGANHAHLVLFGAGDVRLAWDLIDFAAPNAVYSAVVDATTGRLLASENLVNFDGMVSVFDHYPGAALGGMQVSRDISPYLDPGATTLTGPNAHVYTDVNDDHAAAAGEEVTQSSGSDWIYPFTDLSPADPGGACQPTAQCTWNDSVAGSWTTNREADATQLFWFVNEYHDHLYSDPIDFNDASGAFDGTDPLIARADVGAAGAGNVPDDGHVNNSTMFTPPDGQSPEMTTQLYTARPILGQHGSFRDVNGADDAATVFHEYTHGLSNRLITNPDGTGALSEVQSSAMGEGWSDWYAMDEIVDLGLDTDTSAPGEIDFGEYTDATPHSSRSEPLDCPVGVSDPACPGVPGHPGGYTYGQLGTLCSCGNEPHFDGEIWAQTLWDLRTALVAQDGSALDGSQMAEELITGAMRLSPPQPSMLDERNAILAEAGALGLGQTYIDLIWSVFAHRGMGWFASTVDANDGTAVEDFSMPPAPGGPVGAIRGTVTDAISGLPLNAVSAGIGGHDTSLDAAFNATTLGTTTDAGGRYTLTGIPAGTYAQLVFHGPVGYDPGVAGPLTIAAAQTVTQDMVMRRDWAATVAGAQFTTNDNTQATFGCGTSRLLDQAPRGWSTQRNPGSPGEITITLPSAIDVTAFAINPTATCGDDASAALGQYKIETSSNGGATFTQTNLGTFAAADNGHLNTIAPAGPAGSAHAVTTVRLTLKAPQSTSGLGALFVDATEFEIYGAPPNVLPTGTLTATPGDADAGKTQVSLQAQFTDPDSKITGYAWDFDGDGTVDQTTTTPTVTHVFPDGGTFTVKVGAQDFRGGEGTATAQVHVTPPPQPPPTVTVTVTTPPATTTVFSAPIAPPAPRPKLKLAASGHRAISFTVTFARSGSARATLAVSRSLARTLRLRSPTFVVATLRASVATAKPKTLTLRLSSAMLAALRRNDLAALHGTLGVTATAVDGQVATATRHVTISR